MVNFQLFFQSKEQVVVQLGQVRRIGWMIKTLEAQIRQFLLGCKCPVSRGIVVQEQDHLGELLVEFILQNFLPLHQQRWVILRVDSLALWNIINEEDAFLIPKNRGENFSRGFLHSEFFGRGEPLCRHSTDCCFFSIRMAWISFGALQCRKKKTWWQLASRCCWNSVRRMTCFLSALVTRKDLQFGTWTDPSFQRHYRFRPKTSGSRSG